MEEKYVVPVVTMLGGLGAWIAVLVWDAVADGQGASSPWLGAALCFATGVLIAFSSFR